MTARRTLVVFLSVFLLLRVSATAQLATGDVVLSTTSGITVLSGVTSIPATPVPGDGVPFPTVLGLTTVEWVEGTHYVLMAVAPSDLFLLDFSSSLSAPTSYHMGTANAAISDIDYDRVTGDALVLENGTTGGAIRVLPGPIAPGATTLGSVPDYATGLLAAQANYMAILDSSNVVVGGPANAYLIAPGSTAGGTAIPFAGTWFSTINSMDYDPTTLTLYISSYTQSMVRQNTWTGGTTFSDLGNFIQSPEIVGPDDVEVDASLQTVFVVARTSSTANGINWGVQPLNDNAILASQYALPAGSGYYNVGPQAGHGNSGYFGNIAAIGIVAAGPSASVVSTGVGCSATGSNYLLGASGLPQLGNTNFAVTLSGGPSLGTASFYLASGMAPAPYPVGAGCSVYLDLTSALAYMTAGLSPLGPFPLDATGALTIPFSVPGNQALAGSRYDVQALSVDAAGIYVSNGLTITLGF